MHWIALPLPWRDEPATGPADTGAAAGTMAAPPGPTAGWWALRFTPRVALVDGDTVLLEVSTTERLWGGRDALLALVLQAWAEAAGGQGAPPQPPGMLPPWGSGPTALVAQAWLRMALAGHAPRGQQRPAVYTLPLHTLTALRPHVASLERMGCRTWGALRALPRAGLARRVGAGVLRVLDQALGEAPEAHAWLELPEQFALATELLALATSADALLWSAHRCLTALQSWLQARQQGALALELAWRHDLRRIDGVVIAPTQALQVRTAQATQDMAHLRRLLSENLARTTLAAPANQITLRLLESAPLLHRSASLLPPGDHGGGCRGGADDTAAPGEALHQLLERLSARLGPEQVQAPVLWADHRPEHMQQWRPAAEVLGRSLARRSAAASAGGGAEATLDASPDALLLPPWLLNPPQRLAVQGNRPCHHGLLRLLAGPHRFEAGWWSAGDGGADDPTHTGTGLALRDYFVAHNAVAGLVWVFRERLAPSPDGAQGLARPPRWFLHGVF
ncbi:MAG: DNA polymerase Y family protein [Acidovorax sp.]|uniref:Y-family DNA polymerase n=1 Tax=Acidovorax sp. TaxID=1872122 RepID=UPI00262EFBF0|nr:DNA polymerase Y family protein [Acidovorax sp.]MDH4416496.1 DNA polymerase Y family protein [Acidovorax sp.]